MESVKDKIKNACVKVLANKSYEPVKQNGKVITKCNLAVYKICEYLGLPKEIFFNEKRNRIMLANEMCDYAKNKREYFEDMAEQMKKSFSEICKYIIENENHLFFATLKNYPHGHIAVIFPNDGKYLFSGKWKTRVPYVANVGIENGIMGLNFAFGKKPKFYRFKGKI